MAMVGRRFLKNLLRVHLKTKCGCIVAYSDITPFSSSTQFAGDEGTALHKRTLNAGILEKSWI